MKPKVPWKKFLSFRFRPRAGASSGVILITCLWILLILSVMAIGIGFRIRLDLRLTSYQVYSAKALYLAKAGVARAMLEIEKDGLLIYDALVEPWAHNEELFKNVPLGGGTYVVKYPLGDEDYDYDGVPDMLYGVSDECSRININRVSPEILDRLPGVDAELACTIVDWRDSDDSKTQYDGEKGVEDSYYQGLSDPYPCKNADFTAPEELLLVKGMTPEIYEEIQDFITVHGGEGRININTASRQILSILFEDNDLAERIVDFRNGEDGIPATEDDRVFTSVTDIGRMEMEGWFSASDLRKVTNIKSFLSTTSDSFRINSYGIEKEGRVVKRVSAVVRRDPSGIRPLTVVSWREE